MLKLVLSIGKYFIIIGGICYPIIWLIAYSFPLIFWNKVKYFEEIIAVEHSLELIISRAIHPIVWILYLMLFVRLSYIKSSLIFCIAILIEAIVIKLIQNHFNTENQLGDELLLFPKMTILINLIILLLMCFLIIKRKLTQ